MYRAPCSIYDGPATLRKISSFSKFKIVEFSQLVITSTDNDILSIGSVFGRFCSYILQGLVWHSLRNGNVLIFLMLFYPLLNFRLTKKIYANTMHRFSILFRIKILQSLIKANFQNAGSYLVVWCHFNHTWCNLVKTNKALNINQFYGLLLNP